MQSTPSPNTSPATRQSEAGSTALAILAAIVLGLLVAAPALLLGGIVWLMIRGNRRHTLWALLATLACAGLIYGYQTELLLTGKAIFQTIQQLRMRRVEFSDLLPHVFLLWQLTTPTTPLIAMLIESLRPRTFAEQQRATIAAEAQRERRAAEAATKQVRKAPEVVSGRAVIGVAMAGDAPAFQHGPWAIYPPELLNRHAVVIGGSGTGKTELVLRLAYLARKVYGWRVFYLDAKGDHATARRFVTAMQQAGVSDVRQFPEQPFHGWQGSATEIFNRLMVIEDFTEPYYRAITKLLLSLACNAPGGPPQSSKELMHRLKLEELAKIYKGQPEMGDITRILEKDANSAYSRYRALFSAVNGALDSGWNWSDAQAGYVLLDGLALKEEARSLGRYLLEDFGQAMVKRIPPGEHVLLIVDEFSALSGAAEAEGLFERVRSPHGVGGAGVIVTAQSYAALGREADRLVQAAATTVVFQCPDPERIVRRGGMHTTIKTSRGAEAHRSRLSVRRTTGSVSLREDEAPIVHPDMVRRLQVGECVILPSGGYQKVRVARLPQAEAVRASEPVDAAASHILQDANGQALRGDELVQPADRPSHVPTAPKTSSESTTVTKPAVSAKATPDL